jgi:hypothetical protein
MTAILAVDLNTDLIGQPQRPEHAAVADWRVASFERGAVLWLWVWGGCGVVEEDGDRVADGEVASGRVGRCFWGDGREPGVVCG